MNAALHTEADAVARLAAARPLVIDVVPASEVSEHHAKGGVSHAGPPIEAARMCPPMRAALGSALWLEGVAGTPAEAIALVEDGQIALMTNHDAGGVGPMAGVVNPSMPVWVARDEATGKVAWCPLNEGSGAVLRYGADGPEVLERLKWMRDVLAPELRAALANGPLDLYDLHVRSLALGDEAHHRTEQGTALTLEALGIEHPEVRAFIAGNGQFFLNLAMLFAKLALDCAAGVPGSPVLTAIARNGVEVGIRVSGLGERGSSARPRCRTRRGCSTATRPPTCSATSATRPSSRPTGSARWPSPARRSRRPRSASTRPTSSRSSPACGRSRPASHATSAIPTAARRSSASTPARSSRPGSSAGPHRHRAQAPRRRADRRRRHTPADAGLRAGRRGARLTRAEQVHTALRAALLNGEFPYGHRLVEEQLAERFETSRTPVREALRRLEGDGHVVRDRSGGLRPNPPRVSVMRELYDVRVVLEDLAVRSADPEALDGLIAEWLDLRSEHDDGPDFVYADEAFHEGIARASGNSATQRYIRDINERIRLIRIHDFTTPDRIEATIEEHLEILETVRAGRADAAAALMRVHIERSAEVVERRVGELLARMFEEERP